MLRDMPVVFSVRFYRDSISQWCFATNETLRGYKVVLGVSIVLDQRDPMDRFFILPTEDFTGNNIFLLSESDEQYTRYHVPKEKVQESLEQLIAALLKRPSMNKDSRASIQLVPIPAA